MKRSNSFHAHHSPMGAHSSMTLGVFGACGGMALERGSPAQEGVYVGYRTASGKLFSMPFSEGTSNDAERYSQSESSSGCSSFVFGDEDIEREYSWASDRFTAPGLAFEVITPFFSIPDPASADDAELQFASCPSTLVKVMVENNSTEDWEGFFAISSDQYWAPLSNRSDRLKGFSSCERKGFATDAEVEEFCDFSVEQAFARTHTNANFMLGPVAGCRFYVPAGEAREVIFVLGYYIGGQATYNYPAHYWYTQYFEGIDAVFEYGLKHRDRYLQEAEARDLELRTSGLSTDQQFLLSHATRSYYGSTEWLVDKDGKPLWIVNEGEYLMMNTLDLTVDMMFFELRMNPWTVRNVLEHFVDRYSYEDEIFDPAAPDVMYPGGISFAHDMGVANHFSPEGYSSYECSGLDRACFSYMTCEQLTNWVLCAGVYLVKTNDEAFLQAHKKTFERCYDSLLNRDHPNPTLRNGLLSFESSRTDGGGEITTYDSLDHSLGQARENAYLGGKCWASYLALGLIFERLHDAGRSAECTAAALRCSHTLAGAFDEEEGFIPAVLDGHNRSAIIPAGEALLYPWAMGLQEALDESGPHGAYISKLKEHLKYVLRDGMCLYPDGGWKLSSSMDNSWMSKICLNQFVVREILGLHYEGEEQADAAHVRWEVEGSKFHACSDQFSAGKPIGSLYYPRIVTCILWMEESRHRNSRTYNTQEVAKV
ncbi:MAG: glycoside hydrolase family 52 protein [Coraliomargaritaceae bacterium]